MIFFFRAFMIYFQTNFEKQILYSVLQKGLNPLKDKNWFIRYKKKRKKRLKLVPYKENNQLKQKKKTTTVK